MAISVLVADAKAKARQEIVHLLRHDRSVDVIGEASDGREALDMARSTRPNIVLLAGSIMGLDAISVVEEIALSSPDTGVIVVVTPEYQFLKDEECQNSRQQPSCSALVGLGLLKNMWQ